MANWLERLGAPFFQAFGKALRLAKALVRPRLGNLNQYAPRKLTLPAAYHGNKPPQPAPRISIVTPSFQQGQYIERTIKSVLEQEYPNLEYFVQDGGSTDQTVSILKSYEGRISGWRSEKDNGQSHAINLALARASGEIMAWLNSDDLLLPGALMFVADYFARHPDVDVLYGDRLLINEGDMEIGQWILPGHDDRILNWADYVPQETLFWRRSVWEKAGGRVDESFRFAMDWDLLVRFRDAGARFTHIHRFLGAFRVHAHQKSTAVIADVGVTEMNRIRARILGRVPDQNEIRRAVIPFFARHVAVDWVHRIKALIG
jgi:glycosyltransferase involved in cell wall biosynthesis